MRVRAKVEVEFDTDLLNCALLKSVLQYKNIRGNSGDKGSRRADFIEEKLGSLSREGNQERSNIILFLLVDLLLASTSTQLKGIFLRTLTDYQKKGAPVISSSLKNLQWNEGAIKLFVTQVLEEKNQNQAQVDLIRFGNGRNDSGFDNEYRHFKAGRKSFEGSVFSDVHNPSMFSSGAGSGVELGPVAKKNP